MRKLRDSIRLIDIFGAPIVFNFDGTTAHKSCFGGSCTIFVVLLVLSFFQVMNCNIQSQIQSFIDRGQVSIESNSNFSSTPLPLILTSTNFLFAVKIDQYAESPFSKTPYFIVNVVQTNQTRDDGITYKIRKTINMEPCTIEYFSSLNSSMIVATYYQNKLQDCICPTKDTILNLQGAYLNDDLFSYVKFTIDPCVGYTNMSSWNVVQFDYNKSCAPQSVVDQYYKSVGNHRLSIYTSNFVTNPQLASLEYSQSYLTDDISFTFQPEWLTQSVNVYFKEEIIDTDFSWFINSDVVTQRYINRQEGFQYQTDHRTEYNAQQSVLEIYFRRDYFTRYVKRKFMKIDQLLAYLGGIFNIFYMVFGVMVRYYNSICYRLEIANKLYDYDDSKISANKKDNDPNILYLNICKNMPYDEYQPGEDEAGDIDPVIPAYQLRYLKQQFNKLIINSKMRPRFKYWIYVLSLGKLFRTKENRLMNKGLKLINKSMNIRALLIKYQEIDKMKQLVLNEYQQKVFSFTKRPQVRLKCNTIQYNLTHFIENHKNTEYNTRTFDGIISAFGYLQSRQSDNVMENTISQKLIALVGSELQGLLNGTQIQDQSKRQLLNQSP